MIAFQQTLEIYELSDMGYNGSKFTWTNCWGDLDFTKVRLDRGVANAAWRKLYLLAEVVVEVVPCSDHTPLIPRLTEEPWERQREKWFRYEERWKLDERYYEVVREQ